jgi:ABC-2 type transport system permease protein
MSEPTLKRKHMQYGLSSVAAILVVAGILIAVNIIGDRLFVRADMTEGKEFTISPATKQILRKLDDLVTVKVYFSKKLPPQLATLEQQVDDVLKEYQVYSGGKVQVRFIDPGAKPELAQEAEAMGIPQLQMNLLEKDQYQVTNVFMGIGVQYEDKRQAIPMVQDVSSLEYDLTSAIMKVTQKQDKTIGFLTGHQEKDLQKDFQGLKQTLDARFSVRSVDLSSGRTPVPQDISCLVVAGPKNVSEREAYLIDQYIMSGGRAVFMIDPVTMNEQMGLQAFPASSGLETLLSSYGVGVKSSMVLDVRNSLASFSAGYMSYTTPYPFWPKINQTGFDRRNPITSRLESLTLPWTAPLELKVAQEVTTKGQGVKQESVEGSPQPRVSGVVLARTTDKAWLQSGRYDLNPSSPTLRMAQPTGQSYPLAVALSGEFQSAYSGKPVPPRPVDPPRSEPNEEETPPSTPDAPMQSASPVTQILVVGNSQFASNTFLRIYPENILFLQNAIDWMTLGNELISIRSRGATERPLRETSAGAKMAVKLCLTFGVAVLVIAVGLVRGGIRRRSRERLVALYRPTH